MEKNTEDAVKRGGWRPSSKNDHGNNIVDHGKIMETSWNFVFEFLCESCNSFSDSFSDYLKTIDHLNSKLLMFCRHTTSFKTLIFKFRILKILDFSPMLLSIGPVLFPLSK